MAAFTLSTTRSLNNVCTNALPLENAKTTTIVKKNKKKTRKREREREREPSRHVAAQIGAPERPRTK